MLPAVTVLDQPDREVWCPRTGIRNTDTTPDARAARLAARQWGVVDNADLWACGMTRNAVKRRRDSGRLHQLFRGVYAWGHPGICIRGRALAAVKACGPGAALSHRSGGALWRLLEWDEDAPIEVTVPTGHARRIAGVIVHRTRVPLEAVTLDGIPVTIPARTLVDLATVLPYKPLRRAVREALARKRVTVRELTATRGKRGGAKLTRILATGYTPTRSELEDAVLDVIERAGLPRPDVNKPIVVGGVRTVPDFRWPERRLVVEADGRQWHDTKLAREDDAERQARLEAAGERVLRVTWQQAVARPAQTLQRLRAGW